jgi:hypothetical protein
MAKGTHSVLRPTRLTNLQPNHTLIPKNQSVIERGPQFDAGWKDEHRESWSGYQRPWKRTVGLFLSTRPQLHLG